MEFFSRFVREVLRIETTVEGSIQKIALKDFEAGGV
jgi:cytochrome P450